MSDPPRVERHGRYVQINYQNSLESIRSTGGLNLTGITIIAKDDKLIFAKAWSCTWSHTFFNQMSRRNGGQVLKLES